MAGKEPNVSVIRFFLSTISLQKKKFQCQMRIIDKSAEVR